ncbi:MAG: flagellar hook-basal body protein [Bacillota bacterium]
MITNLWQGVSGMVAQQTRVDVVGHNLANEHTVGFKSNRVAFIDLLSRRITPVASQGTATRPSSGLIGTLALVIPTFDQGIMVETGNQADLALEGSGFFKVVLPDGSIAFTRGGTFSPNANGELMTAGGYLLDPVIVLPPECTSYSVRENGEVLGADVDGTVTSLGMIEVYTVSYPENMAALGRNLYTTTPASGPAILHQAGAEGVGVIKQGFREQAEVDLVTELTNLIVATRAYAVNARAVQAVDEMWGGANNLRK